MKIFRFGALTVGGAILLACGTKTLVPDDSDTSSDAGVPAADSGVASTVGGAPISVGGVTVSPSSVHFGGAACGAAQTATFTLTNTTDTAAPYTLTVTPGGAFSLVGSDANGTVTGSVVAHGTASVIVTATGRAPGTTSADISATIGGAATTLNVALETRGALLAFDPGTLDFGQVRQGTASAAIAATLRNDGLDPITIASFSGTDDFVTPTNVTIAPQSSIAELFSLKAGAAGTPLDETATPVVTTGTLCGAAPTLELKGARVSTSVTVNPATLDVGTPACGSTPTGTKTVTISNYSTLNAIPYTLALPGGSKFTLAGALSGQVPQATDANTPGTVVVSVGLAPTGATPGVITDTLTVGYTPDGAAAATTTVALQATVVGAVIKLPQNPTRFTNGMQGNAPILNEGNVTVCVHYTVDNSAFVLEADHGDTLAAGETDQDVTVSVTGPAKSENVGRVSISSVACPGAAAAAPLCGDPQFLLFEGDPAP